MEIFTLLETLEDILERGKSVPFTTKSIIDKEIISVIFFISNSYNESLFFIII